MKNYRDSTGRSFVANAPQDDRVKKVLQDGKRKKELSPRAQAAKILLEVLQKKRSLTTVLQEQLKNYPDTHNRGFIQELCYGVLRWREPLAAFIQLLMPKPLKSADQDIDCLLLTGLYQLKHLQTKPHAAIFETAQAARELKKPWAVGLINGVLRHFQREQHTLENKLKTLPATVLYAHPYWLINAIQQAWPTDWETILTANNQHPPLTLRVNNIPIQREPYLSLLREQGIQAFATSSSCVGVQLVHPQNITTLPLYDQGGFSVQDEAAQLATGLLELAPGQIILDACAAPGGKTAHILEYEPLLSRLTAIDNDALRLARIQENLTRLQLLDVHQVKLLCADAAQPDAWWDGQLFDRILLDAPCSATGVIRRHPDIKYLRQASDISALTQLQWQLLKALWPLLKPNGILVYATCSILPQENHLLVQQFLQEQEDAEAMPIQAKWGIPTAPGQQILPGASGMDGFYYAKLRKITLACTLD